MGFCYRALGETGGGRSQNESLFLDGSLRLSRDGRSHEPECPHRSHSLELSNPSLLNTVSWLKVLGHILAQLYLSWAARGLESAGHIHSVSPEVVDEALTTNHTGDSRTHMETDTERQVMLLTCALD